MTDLFMEAVFMQVVFIETVFVSSKTARTPARDLMTKSHRIHRGFQRGLHKQHTFVVA